MKLFVPQNQTPKDTIIDNKMKQMMETYNIKQQKLDTSLKNIRKDFNKYKIKDYIL